MATSGFVHAMLDLSTMQVIIACLIVLLTPLFLHQFIFRASGLTILPSILIVGPSGAGKTSLLTLMERGQKATTYTSQTPVAVEIELPVGTVAGTDKYRSINDPTNSVHKKFLLVDSPGHGKLRDHAKEAIVNPQNLKGVIFMADAAALSSQDETLRQTAEYLHDILLLLQKRATGNNSSKALGPLPLLIAANKMDLFTALPVTLVKSSLESEITKVRSSRSKALLDSGVGMDVDGEEAKDDWLGEMGSESFRFSQLDEFNISVELLGGNVISANPQVEKWWNWIADRL